MIIAFSFLNLINSGYKAAIEHYNSLTTKDWLHFDVMDGKFVSNTTFNYELVKEINTYNKLYADVHLMCDNPIDDIKHYAEAGAKSITFHYEAVKKEEIMLLVNEVRTYDMKVGISIKPNTNVEVLEEFLPYLDNILIMSVEPGKGGQKFLDSSIDKIKYLRERQDKYHYLISVDGGINNETAKLVKEAGADVIIVGTYLANSLKEKTMDDLR